MKYDIKFDNLNGFYQWNKKNFLLKKSDKRYEENQEFKKNNGFSEDETWNLYISIALFVLPRLKHFKKVNRGHPVVLTEKQWNNYLDKMIFSFENVLIYDSFEYPPSYNDKFEDKLEALKAFNEDVEEGFELFGRFFRDLWW
jgi:hypothetical protein